MITTLSGQMTSILLLTGTSDPARASHLQDGGRPCLPRTEGTL